VPGGYLAGKLGGRWVYGIGIVMTAVLSLLTPLAARVHFGALIALRALEGFFEGVTFPAMHQMWGRWAPPAERSILSTITYAGPFVGNVVSFPLSAVLCVYGFDGGWPSVFYVFGTLGTIWFIFWLLLGFSSPATHPRISEKEKIYIESSIASQNKEKRDFPIPWFQIFTSGPVWAIIVAHFCINWGNYTMLTCIPSYFHDALSLSYGNDIILNGIYSGLPYIGFVLATIIGGSIADLLRYKCLSTKVVRKIYTSLACIGGAAGILCAGYFGKTQLDSVIFITISVTCVGFAQAGFNINHIDIAPKLAGVLMGITNCIATIPGIVGPYVAKAIAQKPGPNENARVVYQDEWREVFLIAAEIYLFGCAVYVILGDGEKQWWADGVNRREEITDSSTSIYKSMSELSLTG
jgi:ACS family sodium-dependent inorganic phosphate cotransporter-like MFS transporter 5